MALYAQNACLDMYIFINTVQNAKNIVDNAMLKRTALNASRDMHLINKNVSLAGQAANLALELLNAKPAKTVSIQQIRSALSVPMDAKHVVVLLVAVNVSSHLSCKQMFVALALLTA
uniref:Uncharacterized protein n=1 Tax=Spironucleus salmonicida TaxID=348837 RepID=V6LIU6_9EUKA|eukprot:EST44243.1 Hypothetical protein SS50377_15968 [Spironucleus salmonicida]